VEIGFLRAGQFIIDLVFQFRRFHEFDRVLVTGNLVLNPQVGFVWDGIVKRCRTYGATATRMNSGVLGFELGVPVRTRRERLDSQEKFEDALQGTVQDFRLEGSETEEFLPPSEAIELLNRVHGHSVLEVRVGHTTISIPIPTWAIDSVRWQTLAANTANAFVTVGGMLGFSSDFDSPDAIFAHVLAATGSTLLAHQFNKAYVLHGHWTLHLYRTTFAEQCGGKTSGRTIHLNDRLQSALNSSSQPDIVGIDIGRTKIRAVRFRWDSQARSWTIFGASVDDQTPKGQKLQGIIACVVVLMARWIDKPTVIGVTWPGCITERGHVGGYSGIVGDAVAPNPPHGVATTTIERLKDFDLAAALQAEYPQARIVALNDGTAWGVGLWGASSNALDDATAAQISDELLAPLGAAMLAWLSSSE